MRTINDVYTDMTELADQRENGWTNDDQYYTRLAELNAEAVEYRRAAELVRNHQPDGGEHDRLIGRHLGECSCTNQPIMCAVCRAENDSVIVY